MATGWMNLVAYFLWVKPSQELKRQQEEKAALAIALDSYRYVEKQKPIPDPQQAWSESEVVLLRFPVGSVRV
ncbi:hypothetical protein A4A49_54371 [Nicotiana attenuata]|uniref:Uncharacterized protein n=1 Tax=Nicotiana attenuata TaxID=49451 RepID=A0A314KZK8_NICAT|nr:hypothetical protein A4A49_54371 [Nicotiana attenuata]